MKRIIIITILTLFLPTYSFLAQSINWNDAPQKGFVYQISNKEAKKLLTKSKPDTIFDGLLHSLIDSFDVKTGWINRPKKGHFIMVKVVGNKLICDYTCVFPYQVLLFKEYDALSLQVLDFDGNVRRDAKVKLKVKRLSFDSETKTYRLENRYINSESQYATVELEGFLSVFNIEKHGGPKWNYDYYNSGYDDEDDGPSFYSYLITDKNRYKPNEKVRFKSYALSENKVPLKKGLEVWLTDFRKTTKFVDVLPHRPGSFAGEIQLHDSLNLVLDRNYFLSLRDKKGRIVASSTFRYEDYELFRSNLDIKLDNTNHYYPEKNRLFITASDVNGLILKDAKATITIRQININKSFQTFISLPDTLFTTQINLDGENPTIIDIPSELFQKSNTSYEVKVVVLNSQNERLEKTLSANHFYSQREIKTRFSNDSICFEIFSNGLLQNNIVGYIQYNNEKDSTKIIFPHKEKINPILSVVNIKSDIISSSISMSFITPQIELLGGIEKDSFNISLINPQQLEVSWYVYQGNVLLKKGSGKEIDFKSLIENREISYYVEILYTFGGVDHVKRLPFIFEEEFLNVSLEIPERIYPGQTVDATIHVNDQLGAPVKGVDLTALAVKRELNYTLPDLPYYGSSSSLRPKNSFFSKSDVNKRSASIKLDYKKWEKLLRLDTMMYYKFTYPDSKPFIHKTTIADSTQFAPFVMKNGIANEIYVIEVDHKPIYFSWTTCKKEFSFYISPNKKHEISLRLYDRVIVLDSMIFDEGKKTIISVDLDNLPRFTKVNKIGMKFTQAERTRYLSLISSINSRHSLHSWLESNNEFIPLSANLYSRNAKRNIVGPTFSSKKTYFEDANYSITYQHYGGFNYSFEDNVVYKLNDTTLLPRVLYHASLLPMTKVNDLVMTKKQFLERKQPSDFVWHPRSVNIVVPSSRINILLPYEVAESGVSNLYFENCSTKKIMSPCYDHYSSGRVDFLDLPEGLNTLYLLYKNGTYLRYDSVKLQKNHSIVMDLNNTVLNKPDSISERIVSNYSGRYSECFQQTKYSSASRSIEKYSYTLTQDFGNIKGVVIDESVGEPMPGVTIQIKGTSGGTVTDIDGEFSLQISESSATLIFSFIGYVTEEVEFFSGSYVTVLLGYELIGLDDVVVIGYGVQRSNITSGAIVTIETDDLSEVDDEIDASDASKISKDAEERLYQELLTLNSIRSNFSDVGFWEPRLYTDKRGESKFKVTFPDDITRWDATVYAMNRYLQTGTARTSIKAYKPLMAELSVPQFLTVGDSAQLVGKVLNYTSDSLIVGKVNWSGAKTDFQRDVRFKQFHIDALPVNVNNADSITTRYVFTREDGYTDGEERTVCVVEQGVVRAEGTLSVLKNGDTLHVKAPENVKLTVEVLSNQQEIYAGEVKYLLNYEYACNEQLASKLIGFVNHKQLMYFEGKPFKYDKDVNKIIYRLVNNQNQEFLWSWWDVSSNSSYWMSAHILRALKCAKDAGYNVDLDIDNVVRKATYKFDFLSDYSLNDIDLLNSLATWGASMNYKKHLHKLDSVLISNEFYLDQLGKKVDYKYSLLKEKLLLHEIRQIVGVDYQSETILKFKKEGIMGEVFFSDDKPSNYWYNDNMAANTIAYRIVKNDSILRDMCLPMQMYFLNQRNKCTWNTYQSSSILMSILPDLLSGGDGKGVKSSVLLKGKENRLVTEFPYKIELESNEELTVKKESGVPLYFTQYYQERVNEAKVGLDGFTISTNFSNQNSILEGGVPVALQVDVEVTNDGTAENVMIEIPIPAACSYADKRQMNNGIEVHREYFKEKTVIFCESLKKGKYTFLVHLLPRFSGKYILNPAQVSLMYVPVVNANTEMKAVEIVDIK